MLVDNEEEEKGEEGEEEEEEEEETENKGIGVKAFISCEGERKGGRLKRRKKTGRRRN